MSTTSGSAHLTDEQFAECVTVAPSAESQLHLEACESCRQELAVFQASLSAFGTTAMAWSEATPKVDLRAAVRSRARRTANSARRRSGRRMARRCWTVSRTTATPRDGACSMSG